MTRNDKITFAVILVILAILCFVVFNKLSKPSVIEVDMTNRVDSKDLTATTTNVTPTGEVTEKPVTTDPGLTKRIPEINADYDTTLASSSLLTLMNEDRGCVNLPGDGGKFCSYGGDYKLNPSKILTQRAERRAEYLCSNEFSHDGWNKNLTDTDFSWIGENLARNFSDTSTLNDAFMASPTHRANILNPDYQWVGIANKDCGGTNQFGTTNVTVVLFGGYNQ